MPPLNRRDFCLAAGAALLGACANHELDIPKRLRRKHAMHPLTDEEFQQIAHSAQSNEEIIIRNRIIGPPHRLDDTRIANVSFIDCDFMGHLMFNVPMQNHSFINCAFHGVRWEGGPWNDLSFKACLFAGRNEILGYGEGSSLFQDCKLRGMQPDNPNALDSAGFCAEISIPGDGRMENCDLVRMIVYCGKHTELHNNRFLSGGITTFPSQPAKAITITNCSNTRKFDCSGITAKSFLMRECDFRYLDMIRLRSRYAVFEHTKASFDFGASIADSLSFKECQFIEQQLSRETDRSRPGLWAEISLIDRLTIEHCSFEGKFASLSLKGEPPKLDEDGKEIPQFQGTGEPIPYRSEVKALTIRNTVLPRGDLSLCKIGTLSAENASLANLVVADSEIEQLVLKHTALEGRLDFSRSRVKAVRTEALERKRGLKIIKNGAEPAL